MGKIQQLPVHEIQKIAAGEVIERPAHVVKELVENALDAKADTITIFIEHGGRDLIRVVDDGSGMSPEDARMSVVHHATSKIRNFDDLATLGTFGFRGEALSSIAAVSRMTLVTKEAVVLEATELRFEGGVLVHEGLCAAPSGTDIAVADLFFNVPARKKFLRTEETEWRTIHTFVVAMALCHPQQGFTLFHNGKLVLQSRPCATSYERARELFESPMAQALVACAATEIVDCKLEGFISKQQYVRYDRNHLFVFVNRRWVKNPKITHALLKGYNNSLPLGRYPVAAVFVEMDPALVDSNVHPRKEEVSFIHPRRIEQAVTELVRSTLEKITVTHLGFSSSSPKVEPLFVPAAQELVHFDRALDSVFSRPVVESPVVQSSIMNEVGMPTEAGTYTLVGVYAATYILIENAEGLVLIDQHAAHERVLYELFAQKFEEVATIPLLFPTMITLSPAACEVVRNYTNLITAYGFMFDWYAEHTLAVRSMPVVCKNTNLTEFFQEMAEIFEGERKTAVDETLFFTRLHHALRAMMACKAAVKAGDVLPLEQVHELIVDLGHSAARFSCPHGRPTSWVIPLYDIEKKFKRKA